MRLTRAVTTHLLAAYLGAGLFAGLLIKQAIPALNPLGVAYITTTWPAQIYCARTSSGCRAMPSEKQAHWMFSF
jgi:hypothetical protein